MMMIMMMNECILLLSGLACIGPLFIWAAIGTCTCEHDDDHKNEIDNDDDDDDDRAIDGQDDKMTPPAR